MNAARAPERMTASSVPERLLVSLLALGTIAALFLFRSADDNRLTSWQWAFAEVHPIRLYALVVAGLLLAHLAARFPLPGRRPAAVLFFSSYAIAALFWGEPEVIVDASRYFTQAKHLEVFGLGHFLKEWGRDISAWTDLPLVPLLYGLVFKLFGESRVPIQAFTTLLFAASVALTYRLGKTLWDEEVGFAAGALLLGIPYLLTQVPCMLVDVPTMFFFTLAVFGVTDAFQYGGAGRILLASLAVFLAFFSKYSTWLLLTVLPVICLVHRRESPSWALGTGSRMALVSGSLVAAAILFHRHVYSEQVALLLDYQAPGLRRWGESFASTFLFQIHPFLTAAALCSAGLALKRRDPRYAIVAWPVLLLLVLQVQRMRYLVPALPMLALMGAYGLQALKGRELRSFAVTSTVACSLVVALSGYLPFLQSTSAVNLKMAGEYLDSIDEKSAEVFPLSAADAEVNPAVSVPILDLFTSKRLIYRYQGNPPSSKKPVEKSALRFTWEYKNPAYYQGNSTEENAAVVVISDGSNRELPERVEKRLKGYRLAQEFAADEGVFRHRTLVSVYRVASPR
ncbi:MAG TPA: glycosyltransferase family 39 protein [Candidatus Methylomirabilis sp.]|nr:glycosyltransferase family 39 protein [Candidatus Methylomirabilis sp.]